MMKSDSKWYQRWLMDTGWRDAIFTVICFFDNMGPVIWKIYKSMEIHMAEIVKYIERCTSLRITVKHETTFDTLTEIRYRV